MNHHQAQPDSYHPGLYRSRHGLFLGICRGFAQWRGFSVFWTRTIVIITMLFTGFWPVFLAYLIIGFILKPEPAIIPQTIDEKEFYDAYAHSRKQALHRLKNMFNELEHRTQRLENRVTSTEYNWQKRFTRG